MKILFLVKYWKWSFYEESHIKLVHIQEINSRNKFFFKINLKECLCDWQTTLGFSNIMKVCKNFYLQVMNYMKKSLFIYARDKTQNKCKIVNIIWVKNQKDDLNKMK